MNIALTILGIAFLFWLILIFIYFTFGTFAEWLTKQYPERKIQPNRDGLKRKREEIRLSIKKLFLSALLISLGYGARKAGWTMEPVELTIISFILWTAVGLFLFDFWFYVTHRLLHLKALYRFHALHHKSVAPTVWSNDNTGFVDTILEHSFYLVLWFIIPGPAAAIFAVRIINQFIGMIGHSGFEFFASPFSKAPWPFVGSTYHDMHHSTFNYNYANFFSIWDRLFGTVHPEYDQKIDKLCESEKG